MKTILTLIAMLLVGNAVADGYKPMTADEARREVEKNYPYVSRIPDMTHINDEASRPMKVDYSIITLPDGKTASVLTFK
ncbi:MAG: hypothetical protein AN484_16675 [Aphanizomenon flos-aquae WA102]|uniref:PepSY domain-containing protein n=1 Tax=Aphanizomenon flos-aquae WA102 TaxID=1710896 RepID=A0A1B7WZV1_APHFL|nr:MAG: hypothetical protein AN484_16675 [Aphanizomenon flos-aquae WA102]